MKVSRNILGAVGLLTLAALTAPAYTADAAPKDPVIDYRQAIMKTLGEQAGALGQILSTVIPPQNAMAHVEIIALTSSTALKAFEPNVPGGKSKPDVWKNWPDFQKRMNELSDNMNKAVQVAKAQGSDAALSNILDALAPCQSCHDMYRNQ